jgi:hypothetical protein
MNAAFALSNKLKIAAIICVTILLILGVLFYWYEYRPSGIRKECVSAAQSYAINLYKIQANLEPSEYAEKRVQQGMYLLDDYEEGYKNCLREHGLETSKK